MILQAVGHHSNLGKGVHYVKIDDVRYLEKNKEQVLNKHGDIGVIFTFKDIDGKKIEHLYWFRLKSKERYFASRTLINSIGLSLKKPIGEDDLIGKQLWIMIREVWNEDGTDHRCEVFNTGVYNSSGPAVTPAVSESELVIQEVEYEEVPDPVEEKNDESKVNF